MSLLPFDVIVKSKPFSIKNEVYLVDTCFLVDSTTNQHSPSAKFRKLLLEYGNSLIYNISVQSELQHLLRSLLTVSYIENHKNSFGSNFQNYLQAKDNDLKQNPQKFLKSLCDDGYGRIFLSSLGKDGKKLKSEFDRYTHGCVYVSGTYKNDSTTYRNNSPDSGQVFKLMSEYALDSADAMLINFGISKKSINGLITTDKDFRYCREENFKIYSLSNYISIPVDKPVNS